MTPVSYEVFQAAVRLSNRAWHVELRDTYAVVSEDEPFERFLSGTVDDYAWLSEWRDFVAEVTYAGVQVQRARVVTVPHSSYTRWGLSVAAILTAAGEEIRYLDRHHTAGIVLPEEDFWLLDDDRLILSVFSDDGRQGGFASSTDPQMLEGCLAVRDQVWARAIPYPDYVASTT
jgi:uncharacterized protein YneR